MVKKGIAFLTCILTKKPVKPVVLAFFCNISAENISRTETVQHFASMSKLYIEHFLMNNYNVDICTLPINKFSGSRTNSCGGQITGESFSTCLGPVATYFISNDKIKCYLVKIGN